MVANLNIDKKQMEKIVNSYNNNFKNKKIGDVHNHYLRPSEAIRDDDSGKRRLVLDGDRIIRHEYFFGKEHENNLNILEEKVIKKKSSESIDDAVNDEKETSIPEESSKPDFTKYSYKSSGSLNVVDMPTVSEVIEDEEVMKNIAARLYDVDVKNITELRRDEDFKYSDRVWRFEAELKDSSKKVFYIKNPANGGPVSEALGMALADILLEDSNFNFFISNNGSNSGLIVTDEFPGKTALKAGNKSFSGYTYGIVLELASALGLSDRHDENIMVSDKKLYNIDFESVFTRNDFDQIRKNVESWVECNKKFAISRGRKTAKQMISERYKSNENIIKELFQEAIDNGANFVHSPMHHLNNYVNTPMGGLD